jgi:hypothetical protein
VIGRNTQFGIMNLEFRMRQECGIPNSRFSIPNS